MEIHGNDILLHAKNEVMPDEIIEIVEQQWPDAVVEGDGTENGFFIYSSETIKNCWDTIGWTEDNDTGMIYVIFGENNLITCVIDDEKKNMNIVRAIEAGIGATRVT